MGSNGFKKYFVKAPVPKVGKLQKIAVGDGVTHWSIVTAKVKKKNLGVVHLLDTWLTPDGSAYVTGWKPVPLPEEVSAVDVDCASDGTVIAIGDNGSAYRFIKSEGMFREIVMTSYFFTEVSVGTNDFIFLVGYKKGSKKDNTIYRYLGENLVEPYGKNMGSKISVAENGTLCYVLEHGNYIVKMYEYGNDAVVVFKNFPYQLVSIGKDDRSIFFLDKNNELGLAYHTGQWEPIEPIMNNYTPPPVGSKTTKGTWTVDPFPEKRKIIDANSSSRVDLAIIVNYTVPATKKTAAHKVTEAFFSVRQPIITKVKPH